MPKTEESCAPRPARLLHAPLWLLLSVLCMPYIAVQAQPQMPGVSPWADPGYTMREFAFPSMPPTPGGMPTMPDEFAPPYGKSPFDAWPGRRRIPTDRDAYRSPAEDYLPDLTGSWRGSGGETVEIQRNRARIWGGSGGHQSCSCVFFLVGQRLIAYSPDTDTVRKYWFKQVSGDRFALIDDGGNLMSFWRVR